MGPNQMDTNACSEVVPVDVIEVPAAILRGTARGLEIVVDGGATVEAITTAVMKRLDEAPGFFRGSDVRIRFDNGPLPAGCLARLDEIAMMFELRIVEVSAHVARAKTGDPAEAVEPTKQADAVPEPNLANGSVRAPAVSDIQDEPRPAPVAVLPEPSAKLDAPASAAPQAEPAPTTGTRIFIGPVRSGVILDHLGHLIIFGDVNPGAEVRATGNIVVLGRLRGTAHAGIGVETGFILALRLEPQQLRIGRKVARAADSDKPASEPEIAYHAGDGVVVERYLGKLPRNLATSL